jgi:hypothetical protein
LTIRSFWVRGLGEVLAVIPSEDFIPAFQSLLQLRFLCLEDIHDVDEMLHHVHHAPVLQQLVVRSAGMITTVTVMSTWPTVAVVQQLIQRTSATLHIKLVPTKSSVEWATAEAESDPTDIEVSGLLHIPCMTQLRLSRHLSPADYHQVLTPSGPDSFLELTLGSACKLPSGFVDHLVRLASLTSLRVTSTRSLGPLTSLPSLCRLSKLSIWDHEDPERTRSHVITQCAHLIQLEINFPWWYGARFRQFFTSTNMMRLERLAIRYFAFASDDANLLYSPVPPADPVAAFRSLTALRYLHLVGVGQPDPILSTLHHAPQLTELVTDPTLLHVLPAVEVLQSLLDRTPSTLQIRLISMLPSASWRRHTLR